MTPGPFAIIGQSLKRAGGLDRVLGTQQYVADLRIPGMLHVKMVSLDCAHARILSIDRSEALKVAGVKAVFTADDIPKPIPRFGPMYADRPLLAVGATQYHGEPVALVAAETLHAAEVAAALVKVTHEQLPAITSIAEALAPGAELVQDPAIRSAGPFQNTNILDEWRYGWGDVETCPADVVIENDYRFPIVTHFAIEPFAYVAEPVTDGINVYSATQNPFPLQRTIATLLELPVSKVRVIAPDPGGAFGGKQHPKLEPVLTYFARRLGRPLRLELTLAESFQAVRRAAAQVHVRTGLRSDGTLVFQDIQSDYLVGAYADIAARVISKASYVAAGPYRVPNVRIVARGIFSHTTPSTAFRGFGAPQANWAVESQIDAAARALGLDRVAIRLKNLPKRGEVFIPNELPADGDWAEVLQKAADAVGWNDPLPGAERSGFGVQGSGGAPLSPEPRSPNPIRWGRGIAMGIKMGPTTAASYTVVRLHSDCSVTVFSGTSDMGQGARTVFAQIVAEELGVPPEKVAVCMGDTAAVPFDFQTSASRSTVCMGNAIVDACRQIKRQLQELADQDSGFRAQSSAPPLPNPEPRTLNTQQLLRQRFGKVNGELIAVGTARSEHVEGHPMGGFPAFYEVVAFATELSVDTDTGEMEIDKMIVAADVGKALNPQHVEMQDEGAAVMGLGHAIMEHIILDEAGRIKNLGALDYRIPTIKDIPRQLLSLHIENGDGPGPYGAKGCAEGGILATAPAIGAAVEEATRVRIRELPLTPEHIWKAMNDSKSNQER